MKAPLNIVRLLIEIVVSIALAETGVMFLLPVVAPGVEGAAVAMLDSGMLSVVAGPIILWRVRAGVRRSEREFDASKVGVNRWLGVGVAFVVVCGLGISVASSMHVRSSILAEARTRFEAMARDATGEIGRRVNQAVYGLKGAKGVYAASKSVERGEFRAYVASRTLPEEFPGVLGLGFIQRVIRADLDAFVAAERADEGEGFAVHAGLVGEVAPRGGANDLYVIKHVYPLEANRAAWGYDVGSDPVRREAVERAVSSGQPALTGRVSLVQAREGTCGLLYVVPVYRNGTSPKTEAERYAALTGLVYAPIVLDDALQTLVETHDGGLDLEIFDGEDTDVSHRLFDVDGHLKNAEGVVGSESSEVRMFNTVERLSLGGRTWTLTLSTTPKFEAQIDAATPLATLVCGGLLTMLIAGVLWTSGTARGRALQLADVMTRELREAGLRSERLGEIARRTSNGIVIVDLEGRIEWVNSGFLRNCGREEAEVIGKRPSEVLHGPRTDRKVAGLIEDVSRTGDRATFEIVNYAKGGRPYLLEIECAPLQVDGKRVGTMMIETDITARRESELRLAASETRFRTMVEGADAVLWEFDVEHERFTYVSPQAAKLGYPVEDWLLPGFWREHLHPEDRDDAVKFCAEQVEAGEPHRFEYRMVAKDGRVVWFDDSVSTPHQVDGRRTLRGVLIDITARKQTERANGASSRLAASLNAADGCEVAAEAAIGALGVVASSTRCAVVRLEEDGMSRVIGSTGIGDRCIKAFEAYRPWKRLTRDPVPVVVGEAAHHEPLAEYRGLFASEGIESLAFIPIETSGGVAGHLVLLDARPRAFGTEQLEGALNVASYVGLTFGRLEAQLGHEQARAKAEIASKAKSEFLANMSHEIRTPLTAILGYTELLREDGEVLRAPARRIETIETIRNAGSHLLTIINDILDISKIEADKMTVERVATPVTAILEEVANLIRPRATAKGVELTARLETPLPETIMSDPTRLRQILMNMAGNAAKFTTAGKVELIARSETGAAGAGPVLIIDVADTGPGMTPGEAGRLFEAFSQADTSVTRKFGGSGLGLTISRRLAGLMGGEVLLLSTEKGKGSCFRVRLPLVAAPGAAVVDRLASTMSMAAVTAPVSAVKLQGRVLLAEDGVDNQKLISLHLRKAGATVDVAENGLVALHKIEEAAAAGTPYDMLLTDMQMPEMDGYTLARTLRERGSRLAIVALTAHAMAEDRTKCNDAGCDDYATKPVDKMKLLATCREWMGKESTGGRSARAA